MSFLKVRCTSPCPAISSLKQKKRQNDHENKNEPIPNKPIFETFGWLPEEMIRDNDNFYIYDVFNNRLYLYHNETGFAGFSIDILDKNAAEQCVNLYQAIKPFHDFLWQTQVYAKDTPESPTQTGINIFSGDKTCTANRKCIRDMTLQKMAQACSVCAEKHYCRYYVLWK